MILNDIDNIAINNLNTNTLNHTQQIGHDNRTFAVKIKLLSYNAYLIQVFVDSIALRARLVSGDIHTVFNIQISVIERGVYIRWSGGVDVYI